MSKKKVEQLSMRGSSGDVHPEIRYICLLRFPRIASELLTFVSSIYKVTNHPTQMPGLELNVTSIDLPRLPKLFPHPIVMSCHSTCHFLSQAVTMFGNLYLPVGIFVYYLMPHQSLSTSRSGIIFCSPLHIQHSEYHTGHPRVIFVE